ncbi:hypothetical protein MMC25_004781 [Agyrium rufum]|nr:hypothetical protein [Agyrium rufum]
MATLFPRGEFAPFFRFLEDYDSHLGNRTGSSTRSTTSSIRHFQPRFDVSEDTDSYQLEGELPGIAQEDINIEFTDAHTIVIRGKVERNVRIANDDAAIEAAPEAAKITEAGETDQADKYHKASVEDEDGESSSTTLSTQQITPTTTPAQSVAQPIKPQQKFWVQERSVGQFHRSFQFPTRVEQDSVKASLKNGILRVTVPKLAYKPGKKITVE